MKHRLFLVAALALAAASVSAQAPISFRDALGATISLPAKAARVVSLSPAVTEILYAVGAGKAVVGDTTYCNYPAEALAVAKVGGYSAKTVSLEAVIAQRPDVVIGEASAHGQLAESLARAGVRFVALKLANFADVYAAIELMGRVAGDEAKAAALSASMKSRLEAIRARTASVPADRRPLVFWETWDEPLMSAGPGSFTGQIIEAAGGRNCFADSSADWPVVSFEAVLARNPDFIMAAASHGSTLTIENLSRRPGWAALKAVKLGRIVLLEENIVSRPGPRFVEAAELMARALYPELFK